MSFDLVDDQTPKSFSGLGTDEQLCYEALKPLDLDGPFKDNFTFPGYKEFNSFEPLLEAQAGFFRLLESSLGDWDLYLQ